MSFSHSNSFEIFYLNIFKYIFSIGEGPVVRRSPGHGFFGQEIREIVAEEEE
jgi:hypothetical protein